MATNTSEPIRPTKKQRELLSYIEQFIGEHGYSPSYREIMNGLNYTSVATVSLHVTSLIRRGHLRKRDRSARSLEVVAPGEIVAPDAPANAEEQWLADKVETMFKKVETTEELTAELLAELHTVTQALQLLTFAKLSQQYNARLQALTGTSASREEAHAE